MVFLFLFILTGILLALPWTQTKLAQYFTGILNDDFGINLSINRLKISVFGSIELEEVLAIDHHQDTLFYIKKLKATSLDIQEIVDGNVIAGALKAESLFLNMKTYKGENFTNLDVFIDAFDDGSPSTGKFLMTSPEIVLESSRFLLIDENAENELLAGFTEINGLAKFFKIQGVDVSAQFKNLSFFESLGLKVKALNSDFVYTKSHIYLDELKVETPHSTLEGQVHLLYNRSDFADFNNKVVFKGFLTDAKISSNDIAVFSSEIGANLTFDVNTKLQGTLNNLSFNELNIDGLNETYFFGDINLKNSFEEDQPFLLQTSFQNFNTKYDDLITLLPDLLIEKLPAEFKKFGIVNMNGVAKVSKDFISTSFESKSDLGELDAQLQLNNLSDLKSVSYTGDIKTDNFQLGKLLDQSKIGLLSMAVNMEGTGFDSANLDAFVKGNISKFGYNQYDYSNIRLEGNFKNPLYNGVLYINDPNLFMDFIGLIDVSESKEKFDFDVYVDYANLKALRWMNDSISIFKGKITANFLGTEIDDLEGIIALENVSYQNVDDIFLFEDFNVSSSFNKNKERYIAFNSKDIVEGFVKGKFKFDELPKLLRNALGGIYKNFKPERMSRNQYVKFDIEVYNKLIEIFYPDIEIGANTSLKGAINGDNNELVLDISSPNLIVFENKIHNLSFNLDTKNPLYLTYIQIDSLENTNYTIADFNLINITSRDTLFFRSEFKGGGKSANRDQFNLNLYQTVSPENKYVVGFQKSDFTFKNYFWNVNENDNDNNRLLIDKQFNNIFFDNLSLTHEDEKVLLDGFIKENGNKNINLTFKNVPLNKITPSLDFFNLEGKLNGFLKLEQEDKVYKPSAKINADKFTLNEVLMGDLKFDIKGDDQLKNFTVDAFIENANNKTLEVGGSLTIEKGQTALNLDARFDDLSLDSFKNIGGEVISNLRGMLSGTAAIEGTVDKPIVNARLFLDKAGLKIPYLNVDFALEDNAIVDLTKDQIIFRNIGIQDTKYNTTGILKGNMQHQFFRNWMMSIEIESDRLTVLDTEDQEGALYFGQAFINGKAKLSGPIDELFIGINATSEKGTNIKIPINESLSVGERSYIDFLSPKEKYAAKNNDNAQSIDNGLEMLFDLKINENAEIEVIIDRDSGHGMKGKGRGSLLMEINTNGKFNMFGDFQVYEGYYDFKYRTVINKRLAVKKYGTIIWEGDPLQAQLNLEASYNVNANPSVLLQNPSFNRKVDTDLIIGVRGTIQNPELDFNFEFPTLSSVFNSEIQAQLNNKETRETQAIYVLATGSFITVDSGLSQSAFSNNLYESLGGVLDNLFQDDDSKFNVGVEIVTADRTPGRELNGSVGVTTSFDINDRISVNGKVGVPVGGVNQSSVVGNVEVLYRLNTSGTANLKAFNRENDINYIGEGIGFTQGLGLSYEVDFSTFRELIRIISGKKRKQNKKANSEFLIDSDYNQDYIDFIEKINKSKNKKNNTTPENPDSKAIQVPEID